MKVCELIEALRGMPQEIDVVAEGESGIYDIKVCLETIPGEYVLIYPE